MDNTISPRDQLKKQLEDDGVLLRIKPYDLELNGYQIELCELKVKGAFGTPVFKFIVRGLRIERIAEEYTLAFYYNTKGYNTHFSTLLQDYFNPQMTIGTPEDKYQGIKDDIAKTHYEYKRDTKDIDLYSLSFRTMSSKYDTDRDGVDYTMVEGEVNASDFIELMKMRRHLDGEKRFAALLTDDDEELIDKITRTKLDQQERRQEMEASMRDPLKEFENSLKSMRDDIGKDKTYEIIKQVMESLIGTRTKSRVKVDSVKVAKNTK